MDASPPNLCTLQSKRTRYCIKRITIFNTEGSVVFSGANSSHPQLLSPPTIEFYTIVNTTVLVKEEMHFLRHLDRKQFGKHKSH